MVLCHIHAGDSKKADIGLIGLAVMGTSPLFSDYIITISNVTYIHVYNILMYIFSFR